MDDDGWDGPLISRETGDQDFLSIGLDSPWSEIPSPVSKMASIRPLTREAVSGFKNQIGFSAS